MQRQEEIGSCTDISQDELIQNFIRIQPALYSFMYRFAVLDSPGDRLLENGRV